MDLSTGPNIPNLLMIIFVPCSYWKMTLKLVLTLNRCGMFVSCARRLGALKGPSAYFSLAMWRHSRLAAVHLTTQLQKLQKSYLN